MNRVKTFYLSLSKSRILKVILIIALILGFALVLEQNSARAQLSMDLPCSCEEISTNDSTAQEGNYIIN